MGTSHPTSSNLFLLRASLLALATLVLGFQSARAQALAEAAGTTSVTGGTTAAVAKTMTFPAENKTSTSPHLAASSGPAPQVVNRRALEEHAGPNAAKLLIRATPAVSQVWIDDKIVGSTPMLLVLAPGKYRVTFRGPRMESGAQSVDLLPRETRELALHLATLYPDRVRVH
jgi:PEGA domain